MKDIKKILVPVDFSEASARALRYGVALGREFEASLVLVHIIEYSRPLAYVFPADTFEVETHKYDEVHGKLRDLIPGDVRDSLDYRIVVKAGTPEDELLASIGDERADLLVMGTHGRRAFERWVLGSVTEHMLRKAPVPVMVVSHVDPPPTTDSLTGGRILYATDLSEGSEAGLELAWEWARRFAAELRILHVMLPLQLEYGARYLPLDIGKDHARLHREISGELERAVPDAIRLDPKVRLDVGEGVPWEVILQSAEDRVDLIVINLHGKSRLERTLIGSTAERVVRASSIPVLAVPTLH